MVTYKKLAIKIYPFLYSYCKMEISKLEMGLFWAVWSRLPSRLKDYVSIWTLADSLLPTIKRNIS